MAMMISKFHKLVGSKKVWTVFAVLISVAFVIAYTGGKSGSQKSQGQKAKEPVGRLFGEKISRQEFNRARFNSYVMLVMRSGQPIKNSPQVEQLLTEGAWQRLAVLMKARQMGLTVTDDQVARNIREQRIFINPQTGVFDQKGYDIFFARVLPSLGINMNSKEFENMMRENLLIDKASRTAVQSALITESEIDRAFHVYADKVTIQYAVVARSMVPEPEITDEEARAYYNRYPNQFTYPEKVKVSYVEFPVSDYTNSVTITDEMVTKLYESNKEMFIKPTEEEGAEPQYQPLEEVRDQIVSLARSGLAQMAAQNAAGKMVSILSNPGSTFEAVAADAGKEIKVTAPFALTDTVRGIDPTASAFTQAAFRLQDNKFHYYSDPVVGHDTVYVLALQSRMPSFLPDFEVVADDVREAARIDTREDAYIAKAESLHAELESELTAGKAFEATADGLGLTVQTLGPCSVQEPPEGELEQNLLRETALFDAGSLVGLIPTSDNELIIAFVSDRQLADRAMADPNVIDQLKASVQNDKVGRLAEAWQQAVMQEAEFKDLSASATSENT